MRRILLCATAFFMAANASAATDNVTQYSTIEALLEGVYDGEATYGALKSKGDFGIGTFNGLDGEMIALDGAFYQITSDGKAHVVADDAKTPFVSVKFFHSDITLNPPAGLSLAELAQYIDAKLPSENFIYAIRITGTFAQVQTRSVPAQKRPYPKAVEVVKQQPVFDFVQVQGTLAGFRFPNYLRMANVPGYHLHFLDAKKQAGGHVLALTTGEGMVVEVDVASGLELMLPTEGDFLHQSLGRDDAAAMKAVEQKR